MTGWDRDTRWRRCVSDSDWGECIALLQLGGWDLLSYYLNGGLGRNWWKFPAALGTSTALEESSRDLCAKWRTVAEIGGFTFPLKGCDGVPTAEVISAHYEAIPAFLHSLHGRTELRTIRQTRRFGGRSVTLTRMVEDLSTLTPELMGYWLHGSVGSSDVKPYWSDVDGLAIVGASAATSRSALERLRAGLIRSRSYMVDHMPYQLHGHFVLAEPDLQNMPAEMFPLQLFDEAECAVSGSDTLLIGQRRDRLLALEMLWRHGVADLLQAPLAAMNTCRKIAFLHRVYLLPVLVFQAHGEPIFKRHAFERLDEVFTPAEVRVIRTASSVWEEWSPPPWYARAVIGSARVFRHNPLLYQAASHWIGRRLPWLSRAPDIDWPHLSTRMAAVAHDVWDRVSGAEPHA